MARACEISMSSGRPCSLVCLLVASMAVAVVILQQAGEAQARYLHPSNYGVGGNFRDFQEADDSMRPMIRREDAESGDDYNDEADEPSGREPNAAASYQNQDDGGGANPGQSSDGYDDSEPDANYEETPVEKEGQADLERFFDDHLGASDRDGMDKENLPTNLIATLSEPPRLDNLEARVLRVAPATPVRNPTVPIADKTMVASPTIETTSFIRLPDEKKMIVTNQITRNTIGSPLVYADRSGDKQAGSYLANDDHEFGGKPLHLSSSSSSSSLMSNSALDPLGDTPATMRQQQQQLAISAGGNQAGHQQQDARNDKLSATGSEVVITEDEDDDRVYVTNATNKPFKIDALGGYDPEADFQDAAKELETFGEGPRGAQKSNPRNEPTRRRSASSQRVQQVKDRDEDEDRESSDNIATNQRQQLVPSRHEISFHDSPISDMYEDASETDEVTFGQDDPYQTDLEAEMRQQQYDKVGKFMNEAPAQSGTSNVAADEQPASDQPESPGDSRDGAEFNNDDGKVDPDDSNAEIDDDYKSSGKPETREDTAATKPSQVRSDDKEEGNWVNDGVDEMDIPSQSHQNFILDKAAKHDAMVRKAAEDEMDAKKEEKDQQAEPQGADEGGPTTSSDGEESQRMPNADYLKNDLVEDDSGYAA